MSETEILHLLSELKNTRDPSKFAGICGALASYQGDSLEVYAKAGIIEILHNNFCNKILDRFDINDSKNKKILEYGLKNVCLKALTTTMQSDIGYSKIDSYINESKNNFTTELKHFYEGKGVGTEYIPDLKICVYQFLSALCIYKPKLVDDLKMKHIVESSYLEEPTGKMMYCKLVLHINYNGIGSSKTQLYELTEHIIKNKQKIDCDTLKNINNLLFSLAAVMKDKKTKKLLKKLSQ